MSLENVELTYRAFDAFNRRDFDALLALMDDDVESVSRLVPMEGRYHGHEGMRSGGTTGSAPSPTSGRLCPNRRADIKRSTGSTEEGRRG